MRLGGPLASQNLAPRWQAGRGGHRGRGKLKNVLPAKKGFWGEVDLLFLGNKSRLSLQHEEVREDKQKHFPNDLMKKMPDVGLGLGGPSGSPSVLTRTLSSFQNSDSSDSVETGGHRVGELGMTFY